MTRHRHDIIYSGTLCRNMNAFAERLWLFVVTDFLRPVQNKLRILSHSRGEEKKNSQQQNKNILTCINARHGAWQLNFIGHSDNEFSSRRKQIVHLVLSFCFVFDVDVKNIRSCFGCAMHKLRTYSPINMLFICLSLLFSVVSFCLVFVQTDEWPLQLVAKKCCLSTRTIQNMSPHREISMCMYDLCSNPIYDKCMQDSTVPSTKISLHPAAPCRLRIIIQASSLCQYWWQRIDWNS